MPIASGRHYALLSGIIDVTRFASRRYPHRRLDGGRVSKQNRRRRSNSRRWYHQRLDDCAKHLLRQSGNVGQAEHRCRRQAGRRIGGVAHSTVFNAHRHHGTTDAVTTGSRSEMLWRVISVEFVVRRASKLGRHQQGRAQARIAAPRAKAWRGTAVASDGNGSMASERFATSRMGSLAVTMGCMSALRGGS